MTYFGVLFTFIVPPLITLALWVPRSLWFGRIKGAQRNVWLPYQAILLHVIIALVYTTPWDNYLVATGVWWYDPALVTGITLGWVPIEEYTFFVLQTLLTGLWTAWMLRRFPADPVRPLPLPHPAGEKASKLSRVQVWSSAALATLWVGSVALWFSGWRPGVYLALILGWAVPPILLQAIFGADILRGQWRVLLTGIGAPTLYLWLIDSLAITSGTWTINPRYTTGIKLGTLPVEEMLFFLVTNVLITCGITLMCHPISLQRARQFIQTFTRREKSTLL